MSIGNAGVRTPIAIASILKRSLGEGLIAWEISSVKVLQAGSGSVEQGGRKNMRFAEYRILLVTKIMLGKTVILQRRDRIRDRLAVVRLGEAGVQSILARDLLVKPGGILIVILRQTILEVKGAGAIRAGRIVRQRVCIQYILRGRTERDEQLVWLSITTGNVKSPLAFRRGWDRDENWFTKTLPKSRIFNEKERVIFPIVHLGNYERTTQGAPELIPLEWRNVGGEKVARVKRAVAHKFEQRAMERIRAGFTDDLERRPCPVSVLGGEAVLNNFKFGNGVEVEIGELSSAQLRVGRVTPVQHAHDSHTAVPISRPLNRIVIGTTIDVVVYAGLKERKVGNIAAVQGQGSHLLTGDQAA